jgi:sulfur carrier protein ThiS
MLEVSLKIQVESLGLPSLSKLIGKKAEMEMTDGSVADLITQIVDRAGSKARKILLDDSGELDMTIQIMLNDEGFVPRDELAQQKLKDGDRVRIMLLVGGG